MVERNGSTLTLPSSIKGEELLVMSIKIDRLKCVGCGACTLVCPVGVLYVDNDDMKCHVMEGCISCGQCVDRCHWQAITLPDKPGEKKN
jgi:ferredoxin